MNLADKKINLFLLSIILFKNELTCHDYQQKKNYNKHKNVIKRVAKGNLLLDMRLMAHVSFTVSAFWADFSFHFISLCLIIVRA